MGKKINPKSFRLPLNRNWNSKWYTRRNFVEFLRQDITLRKYLKNRLKEAGVARIDIERSTSKMNIVIYAAKPGVIIGRSGVGIEDLKKEVISKFFNKPLFPNEAKVNININILEVDHPGMNAQVIVDLIIADLEKRMPFRKVMKATIGKIEKAGAKGVKVTVSGRLNGAEIARTETLSHGKLPLHTLRADIDYSRGAAQTIYGKIGVKVWIYKGDVFHNAEMAEKKEELKENNTKNKQ